MKTTAKRYYTGSRNRQAFYRLDAARSNTMSFTSGRSRQRARVDARKSSDNVGRPAATLASHNNTSIVIVQTIVATTSALAQTLHLTSHHEDVFVDAIEQVFERRLAKVVERRSLLVLAAE